MYRSKWYTLILLILIPGVLQCGGTSPEVYREAGLATGQPGMNTYPADQAGETSPLERAYTIAPPVIPHDVSDFEVSRSSNDCLGCHLGGIEIREGHVATRMPDSHWVNDYTGEEEGEVVGIRYQCLQCHVPQTTAETG